jgi:hypothetical protein
VPVKPTASLPSLLPNWLPRFRMRSCKIQQFVASTDMRSS